MLQIQSHHAQFVMLSQKLKLEIIVNLVKIFESDDLRFVLVRVGGTGHNLRVLQNKEMAELMDNTSYNLYRYMIVN